ncbi:MAG TPA: (d)CMP kinase [Devosia sp.]|nr:(d)CMP kinase [Devosia sp.]
MIIAIDGPAASGKGTIARALAKHYGLAHLDTGLLYRAVGRAVLNQLENDNLEQLALKAAEELDESQIDGAALDSTEIAMAASKVARFEPVRVALRQYQREFADQPGGAVLDGRDIGTRICPDAETKLFITAEPEVRAARRVAQFKAQGIDTVYDEILAQIVTRDKNDRQNPAGAFYLADGAHLIDTSQLDIEAALRQAIAIVDGTVEHKMGRGASPK